MALAKIAELEAEMARTQKNKASWAGPARRAAPRHRPSASTAARAKLLPRPPRAPKRPLTHARPPSRPPSTRQTRSRSRSASRRTRRRRASAASAAARPRQLRWRCRRRRRRRRAAAAATSACRRSRDDFLPFAARSGEGARTCHLYSALCVWHSTPTHTQHAHSLALILLARRQFFSCRLSTLSKSLPSRQQSAPLFY